MARVTDVKHRSILSNYEYFKKYICAYCLLSMCLWNSLCYTVLPYECTCIVNRVRPYKPLNKVPRVLKCHPSARVLSEFFECSAAVWVSSNALCVVQCLIRDDWNKILSINIYFMQTKKDKMVESESWFEKLLRLAL